MAIKEQSQRQLRGGQELKRIIAAEINQGRVRNLEGISTLATVMEAQVSPDLKYADVYFITLLNQASGDRKILSERLNLSADQQKYIDNSEPGEGLLIFENVVLPFSNPIPRNTQLYKIMTTRLNEVVEL